VKNNFTIVLKTDELDQDWMLYTAPSLRLLRTIKSWNLYPCLFTFKIAYIFIYSWIAHKLSGLNPFVAAVLRDSVYVVSLLPRVPCESMLYAVCKVEQFVLTIIKRRVFLLLLIFLLGTQNKSNNMHRYKIVFATVAYLAVNISDCEKN